VRRPDENNPRVDALDRFHGAFIAPGSAACGQAVLSLAKDTEFGKRMIKRRTAVGAFSL